MMLRSAFVLAALALPVVTALYSKSDAVVQLTGATFEETIIKADGVSMVEFYAPWCGHCKNLSPHYKTVAQKLKGIVTIAAVDCDDSANKKLCSQNAIKGFPTIKLYGSDKMKNPYTGEFYKEAVDFKGSPSAKGLMDAATSLLSSTYITRITSVDDFEKFSVNNPGVAKVFLFTSKTETPIMYKGLSMQLHRGLDFAEVHKDVKDVVAMHEVQDFPTIMVAKADGTSEVYSGDLKAPQLAEFLAAFSSAPAESEKASAKDEGSKKAEKQDLQPKVPEVQNLTMAEAVALDEQEDMWLLALYSPGDESDCADSEAEFKQAVTVMQDVVKTALVAVNLDEADTVSRYGASPSKLRSQRCTLQLVLLPYGEDKADIEDYSIFHGALDGKVLQKWVTDAMPTTFTTEVTLSNFQYFASSPPPDAPQQRSDEAMRPMVRVLLFTNKDEAPGVYKALATNFKASFGFGWVQSTLQQNKDLLIQFGISKVPALVFVAYVPEESPDEEGRLIMKPSMGTYRGPMKYSGMVSFLDNLAKAFAGPEDADGEGMAVKLVPQVADDDALEEHCTGKGGICVIGVLDPSLPRHEQTLQLLVDIAIKRRGQPFHFSWIDGRRFRSVVSAFGVLTSDMPSVVGFSAKRMRYAAHRINDAVSLVGFIDGILSGKVRTEVLQQLPSVTESTDDVGLTSDAAESAEPEPEVVEEFDLSDILSEEVQAANLGSMGDRLKQVEQELQAEEEARAAAAAKTSTKKTKKKSKKSKSKAKSEL